MGVIVAHVDRPEPVRRTGTVTTEHFMRVADPLPDQGDPFAQPVVRYGDFYQVGKIHADPGVNVNMFTNIPQLQSIAQKFFGSVVSRLSYHKGIATPFGQLQALGGDFNVNTPESISYGEMATFAGHNAEKIRSTISGGY